MNTAEVQEYRHYLDAHLTASPANSRAMLLLYTQIPHGPCDAHIWAQATWSKESNFKTEWPLKMANLMTGFELMCEEEGLCEIPVLYRELFHRTREFAGTVGELVRVLDSQASNQSDAAVESPSDDKSKRKSQSRNMKNGTKWAEAASLLIQWSIDILRNPKIRFERFLLSQRESIYWILDDALLRLCLAQWEHDNPAAPWDIATAPLQNSLARARSLVPEWADRDAEEYRKWALRISYSVREALEDSYFERSRKFLNQSRRVHELWRTMRLWGGGRLPAELADVVVRDVSFAEDLPVGELRGVFLPKDKVKEATARTAVDNKSTTLGYAKFNGVH